MQRVALAEQLNELPPAALGEAAALLAGRMAPPPLHPQQRDGDARGAVAQVSEDEINIVSLDNVTLHALAALVAKQGRGAARPAPAATTVPAPAAVAAGAALELDGGAEAAMADELFAAFDGDVAVPEEAETVAAAAAAEMPPPVLSHEQEVPAPSVTPKREPEEGEPETVAQDMAAGGGAVGGGDSGVSAAAASAAGSKRMRLMSTGET